MDAPKWIIYFARCRGCGLEFRSTKERLDCRVEPHEEHETKVTRIGRHHLEHNREAMRELAKH